MTHQSGEVPHTAHSRRVAGSPSGGMPVAVVIAVILGAVVALAILVGAIVSMLNPSIIGFPEGSRPSHAAERTSASPVTGRSDGTHTVGAEIPPGVYVTKVPHGSDHCYWARLSHPAGDFDDIIANGTGRSGDPVTVRIDESDRAFATSGCGRWHRA